MNLAGIFITIAHKKLTAVDLPDLGSNQHELNGTAALRSFFGTAEPTKGTIFWHYFADDEDTTQDWGEFTFYDARAKSADRTGRSEWRFYYEGIFLARATVGDTLILVKSRTDKLFGLVFQQDSSWLRAARMLFAITDSEEAFGEVPETELSSRELHFAAKQILRELGLEVAVPSLRSDEGLVLERFGPQFPTTREMSAFARTQVETDVGRPDETLVRWLEREEQLFRALENHLIGDRLRSGFESVDTFIEYSLSVQNRRKARMGFALQNHLQELFTAHRLRFTAQARTEANNRPDFIFPGETEYRDPDFDATLLLMLGVKSTSKDRWRQVLTEADRIPRKHLCTLEAGISTRQTDEMQRQQLTLIIPEALHETYTSNQRLSLMSVTTFIHHVRDRQRTLN